jgi:Zn-dependent M28 family amino/carboxypeptidase
VFRRAVRALIAVLLAGLIAAGAIAAFAAFCIRMPGESWREPLPALSAEQQDLRNRLAGHVYRLAAEIGERNYAMMPRLQAAAEYIEAQFADMGYVSESQVFGTQYRNIIIDLYGTVSPQEILVVGAHYDTSWLTPGADDNASGVAALLEMARALRDRPLARSVRLIAFANEELPFYGSDEMGSLVAARRSVERGENIVGMLSLEMLGYYSDAPGSQRYPPIFRSFYPDRGNFIAFVGNLQSRRLVHEAISHFRARAEFPSEGISMPRFLARDIARSDNAAYWESGFPAVMITDTANFRNRNYHRAGDTHDTLDYDRMARAVDGLIRMVEGLAGETVH